MLEKPRKKTFYRNKHIDKFNGHFSIFCCCTGRPTLHVPQPDLDDSANVRRVSSGNFFVHCFSAP